MPSRPPCLLGAQWKYFGTCLMPDGLTCCRHQLSRGIPNLCVCLHIFVYLCVCLHTFVYLLYAVLRYAYLCIPLCTSVRLCAHLCVCLSVQLCDSVRLSVPVCVPNDMVMCANACIFLYFSQFLQEAVCLAPNWSSFWKMRTKVEPRDFATLSSSALSISWCFGREGTAS